HRSPVSWRRQRRRARGRAGRPRRSLNPGSVQNITRIGIVGAGTMGNGIAQVFAQAGFDVRLIDTTPAALERARSSIEKSLDKFVEKGRLTAADRDATLG